MTIKVLMVDVDGVIIRPPEDARWFHTIEQDIGVSPALLTQHYFNDLEHDVSIGEADAHERLSLALARFAPQVSADKVIDYLFAHDGHLDQTLMADLAALRGKGVALHLATNQSHIRADYLWMTLDLRTQFDAMHHSAALGVKKPTPGFFAKATERCGLAAEQIGFIDDLAENVEAARAAGWRAHLWAPDSRLADALVALGHG